MIGNIYISGQIGTHPDETGVVVKGVELTDVIAQVKKQSLATSFNVHINSEGGDVDTGFDIYSYLKSLGKPITTIGSGIVASISTVIFMAGDTRIMRENTPFMIHLPWGTITGNSEDIESYNDFLKKAEKKMVDFYKKSLDLSEEAVLPMLRNETWLTSEQLAGLGFTTSTPLKAVASANINFKNKDKMSKESENAILAALDKFSAKVDRFFKFSKPVAKLVQDAAGVELNFEGLGDSDTVTVGEMAAVDGQPAEGDYTMPDGTVYKFVAGELTEIVEPDTSMTAEQQAQMKAENDALKAEVETLKASNERAEGEKTEAMQAVATFKKDIEALKAQVKSNFKADTKKPASNQKQGDEPTSNYSQAVAKAKANKK